MYPVLIRSPGQNQELSGSLNKKGEDIGRDQEWGTYKLENLEDMPAASVFCDGDDMANR